MAIDELFSEKPSQSTDINEDYKRIALHNYSVWDCVAIRV